MKQVKSGSKFRKDFKHYMNKPEKLEKLYSIIGFLQRDEPVPKEYKPHMLSGNYSGHMECHIENDFLLIWIDESKDLIKLIRLGSHSELF